jgi:hypothetical protein
LPNDPESFSNKVSSWLYLISLLVLEQLAINQ